MGCSPPYTDSLYDLTWVKRGSQSAYVVFPRSDLSLALRLPYSTPTEMRAEPDGSITVCIEEAQRNLRTQLWYTLDSTFRVTRLVPDDFFWPIRDQLVADGQLPAVERRDYLESLIAGIQYWTDSGWVSEEQLRRLANR